ncbi:MAG: hypothetical protein ACFFER_17600 [Candidatus Thorarchaeota archaeon]
MPNAEEVIEMLDIEIDKRLQDLSRPQLIELAQTLVTNLDKKALSNLISDDRYFMLTNLVKWLEKKEKDVLLRILNEPREERDLRQPVRNWLREIGFNTVDFEVPIPVGGRGRAIDVCGFKKALMGLSTDIRAVELKSDPKRGSIDKAFAQAKDNAKGVNYSYVAFSPFVFLKYADVILEKYDDHEEIGLLIVDSLRVIVVFNSRTYDVYENDIYNEVKNYMEKR